MKTDKLNKYTQEQLKLVCVYTGLCKNEDNLTTPQLKKLLSKNANRVIDILSGGSPATSPFAQYSMCTLESSQSPTDVQSPTVPTPKESYKSPFSFQASQEQCVQQSSSATLSHTSSVDDCSSETNQCQLYKAYQNSYSDYITMFKEQNPYADELFAKYSMTYTILSDILPIDSQKCNSIVVLNNGTNAQALIYESYKGLFFVKIQKNSEYDDFDRLETDCIFSKLLKTLVETDNTFRNNHMFNFLPSITSYILAPNNDTVSYLIKPVMSNMLYYKTVTLPALNGDSIVHILKRRKMCKAKQPENTYIYFDPDTFEICIQYKTQINEERFQLATLLYDLFKSMHYLYTKIEFIHNDSHLNNVYFDRIHKKLVLIDYGRSTFNIKKNINGKLIQSIANSEVQKMNLKNLDNKYPQYPKHFLNSYSIYVNEVEGNQQQQQFMYMNDIASISFNFYRYFVERRTEFPKFEEPAFFKVKRVQYGGDRESFKLCLQPIEKINNPVSLSKYENKEGTSITKVLQPGLLWLSNYLQNIDVNNRPTSIEQMCEGYYMAPLLANGVFNSVSYNKNINFDKIAKDDPSQLFTFTATGGAPTTDNQNPSKKVSNTEDPILQMYRRPETKSGDLKEIIDSFAKNQEEEENAQEKAKYTTPKNPIPRTTPQTPDKTKSGNPSEIDSSKDDEKIRELKCKFQARMKQLEQLFSTMDMNQSQSGPGGN